MKLRYIKTVTGLILPVLFVTLLPLNLAFAGGNDSTPPTSTEFNNDGQSGVNQGGNTPRVAGKDVPKCNKETGGGMFTDTDANGKIEAVYRKYYKAPSNLCNGGGYTRAIIKCIIAEDVFRFYGTESNPLQGSTLTRVYNTDYCANDQIGVKDYLPNPVDAAPAFTGVPSKDDMPSKGTIYNPSDSPVLSTQKNQYGEPVMISDNCTNPKTKAISADTLVANNGKTMYGGSVDCYVGAGYPRIKSGESCQALQSTGENSIANAIKGNDNNAKDIRTLIYSNYSLIFNNTGTKGKTITSRYPASYSAAVNNLPYSIPADKSVAKYTSADQITSMDNVDCSSIFDFIPVAPKTGVEPEAKMMGTCVVPVYLPARVEKMYGSGEAVYDFWHPYTDRVEAANVPRYLDVPMKVSNGTTAVESKYSISLTTSQANSIYAKKDSFNKAIPNSMADLVFKDYEEGGTYVGQPSKILEKKRTGGYFFPINTNDTKVPYAISPSTTKLKYVKNKVTGEAFTIDNMLSGPAYEASKETKKPENVASSALNAASCYGLKLKPYLTSVPPTPTPTPSDSKTPTETSTPTPSPTPTNTKNVIDESIQNPGGDHNAPCTGPVCVRVTLQAPATFTVGGTSRIQTVKATNVQLICNGHTCDPSSSWDNSDPVISTPIGQLSVVGTGGFTACSSSLQKDCDLAIKSSTQPSSPITSASVSLGFYSPTRTSEAAKITLPAASVTITNKKLVCVVSHVVSYGPSFDDKGKMTSPGGSYTVCDREGWVPDSSTTHSLGSFELFFPAGQSASKPVSGTIGK